jgi:hypothetical protein
MAHDRVLALMLRQAQHEGALRSLVLSLSEDEAGTAVIAVMPERC